MMGCLGMRASEFLSVSFVAEASKASKVGAAAVVSSSCRAVKSA